MGSSYQRADFVEMFRSLRSRVADLERLAMRKTLADNRDAPWVAATLDAPFTNTGSSSAPTAYYKDTFGRVYLRGSVNVAGGVPEARIFRLVEGYRPAYEHEFVVFTAPPMYESPGISVAVRVTVSGDVLCMPVGLAESVPLDVVQFRVT